MGFGRCPASAPLSETSMSMKANVGGIDRIARIVMGLVFVGLAATGTVGVWGWLGLVPLAPGLVGWCPPYAMLGWSTCAVNNKP